MRCSRRVEVHPDAIHPELYVATRPKECREHVLREMKKNREIFREGMKRIGYSRGTNHCKPPSLYLPEFGKEFTDEPCPYTGKNIKQRVDSHG